ncbi:PAS domain-containing hybrid sensor histidine kinase/response regulator [Pelomonas sp. SE-A7]|uniref:PAS domain-containing hybrid sensor histidine kinase/response regulator n=1 Tax=Pelomonas sp. SE-A7 TaxID=3054953 RepID=UPI00259CA0F2|nr:PAS domain-containing hybrid sensor histidine kinase/response regulator [Pelomonas sp. SE-A7]MDM4764529.1 ATP-binding protein [Pelomonas sp. SE-A7]
MTAPDPQRPLAPEPAEALPQLPASLGLADLQLLADQLPLGVLLIDTQQARLLHLNREAERLLGLRRQQALGQTVQAVLDPALAALCEPARWLALAQGRRGAREELSIGGHLSVQVQRSVLAWSGLRRPVGMLSLADLGSKRQLERALRESDTRFREVTDAVRECLFVTTPEWDRLHFASPLLLDMLGLNSMDLRQGPQLLRERIHPDDRALYDRRLLAQAQGEPGDMVLRVQHPTKGQRWLRLRTRLQAHGQAESLVYAILADITEEHERHRELQRARDVAEAASRAKSEFMATMSHELRTPMNGMLGMTELLLGTRLDSVQRHYAETSYRSAETLNRLLDNVLDFARASSGQMKLDRQDFELSRLAERLQQALAPRAEGKGLQLELRLSALLPQRIQGDSARLQQVLQLLLDNAIKFTREGRVALNIGLQAGTAQRLLFEVVDSGEGIEPERLSRLFKAFSPGDSSLSRAHGGAGMGLATARQLVELMGGEIGAESQPGQGSRFFFSLPLESSDDPAAAPAEVAESPAPAHAILVVEDNAVNQEVLREMLAQLGYQVEVRSDALQGLQALCEKRYDLVLMDIHMPGMDGMEALSLFRQGPGTRFAFRTPPGTPVVAVTANALDGDERRLLQHGFDDYLSKPLRRNQLIDMLKRRLPVSRADASPEPALMESSPPSPPASGTTQLDALALAKLRELDPTGGNQLLNRIIQAYMKSLDRLLPDLAQARAAGLDLGGIRHVAHTLKSSSASLGALALAQRCAEIEALARNGQTEGLEAQLDDMLAEIEGVRAALNQLLTTAS